MFRLAVADLDSPSYFVATAAVELGCFEDEGIEVELERIYGAHVGPERLRDGTLHFYRGPAYAATSRSRLGMASSFSVHSRNIPTGFWPFAQTSR